MSRTTIIFSHKIDMIWLRIPPRHPHHTAIPVNRHWARAMRRTVLCSRVSALGHRASRSTRGTCSAEHKRTTSKQGMVNGSRLVLCCFMLCVLITNPFNHLLNLIHSSEYRDPTEMDSIIGSRTLQSAADHEHLRSSSTHRSLSSRSSTRCSISSISQYIVATTGGLDVEHCHMSLLSDQTLCLRRTDRVRSRDAGILRVQEEGRSTHG